MRSGQGSEQFESMGFKNNIIRMATTCSKELRPSDFTFIVPQEHCSNQLGLPYKPCPVRTTNLGRLHKDDPLYLTLLADDCICYCKINEGVAEEYSELLIGLCFIAGQVCSHQGRYKEAQEYFAQSYLIKPFDIQIASNYMYALSRTYQFKRVSEVAGYIGSLLKEGDESKVAWTNDYYQMAAEEIPIEEFEDDF